MSALPKVNPVTVDRPYGLPPADENEMRRLEGILDVQVPRYNQSRKLVRETLLEIHDKMYYAPRWGTFEKYLAERWLITRRTGYQWLELEKTKKVLEVQCKDTVLMPTAERQTRELGGLPDEAKAKVWKEAVELAGGKVPSGTKVKAVRAILFPAAIPDGAELHVEEPDHEPEEPFADPHLVDAADVYLGSLPLSGLLSGTILSRFQSEALAFRDCTEDRLEYARKCKARTNKAKRDTKGHIGPWMARHHYYLRLEGPERWTLCNDCNGGGTVPLLGECAACHGHGYHV